MDDKPEEEEGAAFDESTWREELLTLNPWARDLTIDEDNREFASARQQATLVRYAEGQATWNTWAEHMLALKAALDEVGLPSHDEWAALGSAVFSTSGLEHRFETEVSCIGFVFPSHVVFAKATFMGPAWFNGATFASTAEFGSATFNGFAWFDGATFTDVAGFGVTVFKRLSRFEEVTFSGSAWFNSARFSDLASYCRATFSGDATFDGVVFSRGALFDKANFSNRALFHHATFGEMAWFGEVTFCGDASFDGSAFTQSAVFKLSIFHNIVTFDGIDSKGIFSLPNATFDAVPSFIGSTFKGALRLDNIKTPRYPWGWLHARQRRDGQVSRAETASERGTRSRAGVGVLRARNPHWPLPQCRSRFRQKVSALDSKSLELALLVRPRV